MNNNLLNHYIEVDPNKGPSYLNPDTITNFETRLLGALRAQPNRLDMWLKLGDPMKNHKRLIEMYTKIFDIAMRHNIEYFLEYGSLLGYVRHHGMIPWDYDMDIACDPENFQKWLEVGKWYEESDPEWGFKFYDDPDYSEPGYCFYLKEDPNVLCDINEYREIEKDGVTYLECTQPDWNYPLYRKDFIYPLRTVYALGFKTYIPNLGVHVLDNVEKILGQCTHDPDGNLVHEGNALITNEVKWYDYDPIPFLLCKLYHPDTIEKVVQWPVLDVPEARTLEEGFELYGMNNQPFIVRKAAEFKFNLEEFKEKMISKKTTTFAWTRKDMYLTENLLVSEALEQWEKGELQYSFLDSPIPGMIEECNLDPSLAENGITSQSLMLILSNYDSYTGFHHDIALGKMNASSGGGGWMYLAHGIVIFLTGR